VSAPREWNPWVFGLLIVAMIVVVTLFILAVVSGFIDISDTTSGKCC